MLLHQQPALDFITWQGLVIVDGVNSEDDPTITQEQYIIQDGKSCKKYIYWDKSNPYVLKDSNEWVNSTSTIKLIYINDNGEGTEVPQSDMNYYYTDKSSGSGGGLLIGKMMGRFDEIDGKFFTITEDIDGIKETLGMSGVVGGDGSLTDKLNQLEKTVEGNKNTISQITTLYNDDKATEELINRINIGFLDIMTVLSEYEDVTTDAMGDLEINDDERTLVRGKMALLNERLAELNECHNLIKSKIDNVGNANAIAQLDSDNIAMNNAINNLNSNVTNVISSNTVPTSAITTVLNFFAQASTRIKNYQETLKGIKVLGLGGVVFSNIQTVKETATEYNRVISSLETIVNGENGLTTQVTNNSTAINQNAETIRLSCMKYDMTTAEITVGDNLIKLDAGKVLMTGTLTWDSLDEIAKNNLKGQDGTNATAEYVMLTGDQIFKYDTNGNPENTSVTLNAEVFNIKNPTYKWYYKQQNSSTYTLIGNTSSSYTLTHNNSIWGNSNSVTVKVIVGWSGSSVTVSDEMTIVKLYDGVAGEDGKDGVNGTDGKDGVNGKDAQYVKITGEQCFKYDDITANPTPTSITLKAESFNITATNSHWYYKDSSNNWQELTLYAGQNTLTVNHNDNIFVGKYATIRYTIGTIYDVFTLVKLIDGADGYTIILSNENHSVPCETDGTYESTALDDAYTTIRVYRGTEELSFSLSKVDSGCTSTYDTSTKTLRITRLTENKATVNVSVTVEGQTFNKIMTITKSLRGAQGLEGNGLEILGEFSSVDDLPVTGNPGDAYMVNGLIYIWSSNTNSWGDGVSIRGEQGIPGRDGVDGQTTYVHIKYSNDGKTFTSNNGEDTGIWMGMYTDFSINDSNNFNDYNWFKVSGEDGENGIVANLTNDAHIIPVGAGGVLGSNAFDGCSTTISLSYNGTVLTDGVTYSYTKSDSVTGTWSNGTYTVTGLSADTGYVDMKATYNGVTYTKRFTLSKNTDGATYYTWIKYADNSNGSGISDDPTGKTYIGIAYNKTTDVESTNPSDYIWSLIKGEKGDTGVQGASGKDGTTYYTWIKYSDNADGTGLYDTPTNTTQYIGIATNRTNAIESTNKSDYTWSKFKGDKGVDGNDGEDAYVINLSNDNHSFVASSNGSITTATTASTVVTAYKGNTKLTPTIGTISTPPGMSTSISGTTVNITANTGTSLATTGTLTIPVIVDGITFNKEFSWAKVNIGANGQDGTDGKDGVDGYTVLLTNESDTFPCESNGNITSAITRITKVLAYKGTTEVTPTIGSLPNINGLTLSRSGVTITIVANTGTSLASSGSFDIPITVDGLSFTKTFSWSKSFKGDKGETGDGSDVVIPEWITDWDNNKTTINGTTVLAPKIFAGSVSGNLPTGVAIGTNVFGTSGTYSNISGIAGYKNGTKTYHLSTDGNILIGNSSGKHISWNGSTLEVVADKIMLGNSAVASQESIDTAINNLEIGGKNFVRNSNFANNNANWELHTDVTIDGDKYMDEGGASLKISKSSLSSDAWTGATQTIIPSYFANDEYTISFWYYLESKSGLDGNICLELKGTNSSGNQVGISTAYVTPTNAVVGTWTRVYATIKGNANLGNVYAYPYLNRNGTVWITNIQVEKGNKITDWSPNYYDSSDSLSQMQGDIIQLIEDNRTYLQIDDNGVSIVSQGQNVAIKTEGEINAIVEEFNNRFTTLENGDGFAMIFDQKYAEYGVGEAITTSRQITDHIDFSNGAIKLYGDSTNFSLTIAQDRMSFQQSGYDIAWMSTDTLYIRDGEFTNSLILGNFKWIPRENGNLSFIHI